MSWFPCHKRQERGIFIPDPNRDFTQHGRHGGLCEPHCRRAPGNYERFIRRSAGPAGTTNPASTASIDGAALYADNCASCHGPLATSSKAGAAMSMIQTAIANNMGGMSKFSTLSPAQLQAIADALAAKPASGSTSNSLDGVALYASNCSSCHGALASSSKRGATASQIQTGISIVGAMSSLSNLTSAQVQAIAAALGAYSGIYTGTDGVWFLPRHTSGNRPSLTPCGGGWAVVRRLPRHRLQQDDSERHQARRRRDKHLEHPGL